MKLLSVAAVNSAYQLQGFIKVKPLSIYADLLFESDFILLSKNGALVRSLKVEDIKEYGKFILIKFEGVSSKEEADSLKGCELSLPEKVVQKAASFFGEVDNSDGEVFWADIEGADVIDEVGNMVGRLVDYIEAVGSTDVFRIELTNGSFALISHNPNHVLKVDEVNRQIIIDKKGLVLE